MKLVKPLIRDWYHDDNMIKLRSSFVESTLKRVDMLLKITGGHISYKVILILNICIIFVNKTS